MKLFKTLAPAVALVALPSLGFAQDATEAAPDINPYIFTTLLFLIVALITIGFIYLTRMDLEGKETD